MSELVGLSAGEIVERVRTGAVTRLEVVDAHLDRVTTANPEVCALTEIFFEQARQEAKEADAGGFSRGTLDGVPMSIKAQYDVAGTSTSHGNRNLPKNPVSEDAPVVSRLKAHGAILIGKGNQPDFAMRWNTFSSESGWTRNPRDLTRSAGGSSGGDAAAVASGMVSIGFGTDLAGSIRVPAAFCKIFGLRATPGRIPFAASDKAEVRTPAAEAMGSQGPFARSVDDLSLAFHATAGESTEHPFSISAHAGQPEPADPVRVARLVDQAGARISPLVVSEVDQVCVALEAQGYTVEDAAFPQATRAPDLWGELLCTELRLRALPRLRPIMEPSCYDSIDQLSRMWPTISDTDTYLARWEEWSRMRRSLVRWMERYPLIVSPIAGMRVPPPLEYDHWADRPTMAGLVEQMRNSLWPACLGLPALALPNGVQIVAAPHRDESLFSPARIAEASLPECVPSPPPQVRE